jgi:NhaP-type Na+/H+ or K+/H+ antiporter
MSHLTEILALLMVLGIAAQWLAWRFQLPAIVLLSAVGLMIGPVLGILRPSEVFGDAYHPLVKLAVAAILFEGGLSLRFAELRQSAHVVWRLTTIAVALSLTITAWVAHGIAPIGWPVAMVFAAITVVTGPTVIMPLLRQARLKRRPASFLKWEGIVNDPTGSVLVFLIFDYTVGADAGQAGETAMHLATGAGVALLLGGVGGWALGRAFLAGLVPEYLKGAVALAAALAAYALSNLVLEEAGLIAATVMGVVLGNMSLPSMGEIRRFKEYIVVLLVTGLFLLLTADLDPHILAALDWRSAVLIFAVVFLVRPAVVWLSTIGAGMSWQERVLVGWIAPRGIVAAAVAGVFGPLMAERGIPGAELLLPLVFMLIFTTVVLHGFSIGRVARRLGLSAERRGGLIIAGAGPWSSGLAQKLHELEVPVIVADSAWHRLRKARQAGVPVYFGEVLSEHAEHSLELGAYSSLLAAGTNDAYNALVCARFAPELGRQNVYQIAANDTAEPGRPSPELRGRTAMSRKVQYDDLSRRWYQGWGFRRTKLTEDFDVAKLARTLPDDALPVLVLGPREQVRLLEADKPLRAEPGEIVIWFGPKAATTTVPAQPGDERFVDEIAEAGQQAGDRGAEKPRPLV